MSICIWKRFKGPECGYKGSKSWCDKTFKRCEDLGNARNFAGYPESKKRKEQLMTIDFRFIGSGLDQTNFIPIVIHRCFKGWKKIRSKYIRPGSDGDIVLYLPKHLTTDAHDARIIIDYLYERSNL